jgi:hypothetical protein
MTTEWLRLIVEITGLAIVIYNQVKATRNIRKIEIATNSMKDALVSATRSEAHAAGVQEGRLER